MIEIPEGADLNIYFKSIIKARQMVDDYNTEAIRQHNMKRCTYCLQEAVTQTYLGYVCKGCWEKI